MKQYPHILSKLWREPMLVLPAWHHAICGIVMAHMEKVQSEDAPREKTWKYVKPMQVGERVVKIPVHGTIVPHREDIAMSECACPLDELNEAIATVEADERITDVIYDFNTPGGTVTGVPETGRRILHSRKNTVAFCDSDCCSGGIWLAEQCRHFFATPSSNIGSVGVYVLCLDESRKLAKEGIQVNAIHAGKFKLLGAPWKPLTKEEEDILQARVNKIDRQFKEAMESYRMVEDRNFGNALVFDGEEATALGFTDGTLECFDDLLEPEFLGRIG